MAELKTRDLKGVELLAVGTWDGQGCPKGGCEFTRQHIDQAVKAGKELQGAFDAPVKLGHDDDQKLLQTDGYPAAGWVKNLRRVGEKLVGDLMKVPEKVAELIDAGAYRKRSVELKEDYEVDGTTYPLVLTGLALLGADLPAVEGLSDITKLYQSLALTLDDDAHVVMFEEDDGEPADVDTLIAELNDWLTRAKPRFRGKPGSPTLTQLHRALREGLKRTAKASKKPDRKEVDVDEEAIRKLLSIDDEADIGEAITGLQKEVVGLKEAEPDKAEMIVLKRELGESRERILTMENDHSTAILDERERHRRTEADWMVDSAIQSGRIAPRNRSMALDMALRAPEKFETFVGQLQTGVDLTERGTSGGTDYPDFEPNEEDIKQAKDLGHYGPEWRRQFVMARAREKGVEVDIPKVEEKA